ncbi:MAG: zf-HC2 domain-containing protein [Elusimicrobia bacterium]|nr:zf-HC2 domain-containing protein [Elusimicrobiota bacterium]
MNCTDSERLLTRLIDNELDAKAAAEMRRHINECPACSAQCAAETRLRTRLMQLNTLSASPDFRARFWQRVSSDSVDAMPLWRTITRWVMPVSITFSSLIALFVITMSVSPILYAAGTGRDRHEAIAAACSTFAGWRGSSVSGLINFSCFCDRCTMPACKQCGSQEKCACNH